MTQPEPTSSHIAIAWVRAQPTVSSYINAMVSDFHAAEDLLQKVALLAVKHYDRYDPERSFIGWTLGIARHEVMHYRRSQGRDKAVFSDDLIRSLADRFEAQSECNTDLRSAIGLCIKQITDRMRKIFWLRYGKGLGVKEMAEQLGMKPNTVSVALHKCRLLLRECLTNKLGQELWK